MFRRRTSGLLSGVLVAVLCCATAHAIELRGQPVQGGLIFGTAPPGSEVTLDGDTVLVSPSGDFVIGFGRDESGTRRLAVRTPSGEVRNRSLKVQPREFRIERVEGLPPRTVSPDAESLARIRAEAEMVARARARRDSRADYRGGFAWPAEGRISGVYGSQRILNGEPRRPHFGVDIAAPTGSPVYAPADGIVTLAHADLFFSGGTLVIDHGQGLSSSFLHLSRILVESGVRVKKGDLIAEIGATGRASGPHLDWRMNWLDRRVDPQLLVGDQPLRDPYADK